MLVVALISVDTYPYLTFSDLTCHLEDRCFLSQEKVFSGCTESPDSKETLGSSDQEVSLSTGKNTGVVLVSCVSMEVHPYSYFLWCGYFRGLWVSFVTTDEFSVRVIKITSRIGVS